MSAPQRPPAPPPETPALTPLPGLGALELIIHDDGSVTFVDLPPELLDVAHALNPDDPLVCERRALLAEHAEAAVGQDAPER